MTALAEGGGLVEPAPVPDFLQNLRSSPRGLARVASSWASPRLKWLLLGEEPGFRARADLGAVAPTVWGEEVRMGRLYGGLSENGGTFRSPPPLFFMFLGLLELQALPSLHGGVLERGEALRLRRRR